MSDKKTSGNSGSGGVGGGNSGNNSGGGGTTSTTIKNCEKHTVHWFRKGLRLHDNPALREGLNGAKTFRCVFVIDPWFAGSSNVGINKWRFVTIF